MPLIPKLTTNLDSSRKSVSTSIRLAKVSIMRRSLRFPESSGSPFGIIHFQRGASAGLRLFRARLNLLRTGKGREHFGGHAQRLSRFDQAGLPLLERALIVALLGESRLGAGAAIPQHGIDVTAQQSGDIHLHGFTANVVRVDLLAVDRPMAILGEHDG